MILPGRVVLQRGIMSNLLSTKLQVQPCGIDLTLKRVLTFGSSGVVDLDNVKRKNAETRNIQFLTQPQPNDGGMDRYLRLAQGSYLVEFNELVDMPLDVMGQIFVRSTLFRSGALLTAGVMDCGYKGVIGALLQVNNVHGLHVYKNTRMGQMVFHQMSEATDGYSGVYQDKKEM